MAVEYSKEFLSSIQVSDTSRADALKSQSLVALYNARQDLPAKKKAQIIETITGLGGENLTLKDLVTDDANRTIFIENIVTEGQTSPIKTMVGDFREVLADVGVTRQGTTNPFRESIAEQVGKTRYLEAGFDTTTSRLRPISIPPEVYQETKDIAAGLLASEDSARRAAGGRMLLMMLGGYRPSDFKAFNVQNIDFDTGIVTGLELKTDKGTKGIGVAYLPRPQLDIVRQVIGNKTSGFVFENGASLDKIIRKEFATSNLPSIKYLQESTRQVVEQPFTLYDFRRMQETTLQAAGFNSDNPIRKYLTWRPLSKKEASEGYMAIQNQSSAIESANALSFEPYVHLTEGNVVELEDGKIIKTHGQFLTDVGITRLSPFTKKYVASQTGRSRLPVNVLEKLDEVDDGVTYPPESIMTKSVNTDRESASKYRNIAKVKQDTREVQAQIDFANKRQELSNIPKTTLDDLTSESSPEAVESLKGKGFNAKGMADGISKLLGKTGKTIKEVALPVAVATGTTVKSMLPTPVEGAFTSLVDQERMGEAEEIGKKIGQDISGQEEGVIPAIGGVLSVGAELATDAVVDKGEGNLQTASFLTNPLLGVASATIGAIRGDKETAPADMYKGGFLSN